MADNMEFYFFIFWDYVRHICYTHIDYYIKSNSLIQNVIKNKTICMFANYSNKSSKAETLSSFHYELEKHHT